MNNIIELLKENAKNRPNDIIYRYIEDENKEPITLTNLEVHDKAKNIANNLLQTSKKGDRALLLYPAGMEFILGFLGCLFAGLIAVPAYPPRKNQKLNRLKVIIDDAEASIVLTSEKASIIAKPLFDEDKTLNSIIWLVSDNPNLYEIYDDIEPIKNDDIAFLQYTSGSTGNPKGVMVSHANVISNMGVIYESCKHTQSSKLASWLPHFHDMGLMAGVLQPIFAGAEITFMAPAYFLQKPIRWLQMMDKYKSESTAGPNFAYDLCIEKINDEDLEGLDLSNITIALNGAEPVSATTIKKFTEKFSKCGFKASAHFPSYGMAETTLMVTAGDLKEEARILNINSVDLQNKIITIEENSTDATQEMVSSGHAWLDHEVIIVEQDNLNTLDENLVGEVWIKGSSVTQGYWKNPEKTKEDFQGYTTDTKKGPYLRTGDLGFLNNSELYICGRAKDLLIIRGRNYYPQDIESVASNSNKSLSLGNAAVFSLDIEGREQLIITQEIKRTDMKTFNKEEIFENIIESIALDCELQVRDIVLLRPGQILKTSSGKIQRQANKKAYLENSFKVMAKLHEDLTKEKEVKKEDIKKSPNDIAKEDFISSWLKEEISILTRTPKNKISKDKSFMVYGLDSLSSIEFQDKISDHFSVEVPLADFYDYPTIKELVPRIIDLIKNSSTKVKTRRKLPTIIPSQENKFDNFQLNDIQQAYYLGRSSDMVLGNTSCFAYAEFASDDIDLKALEKAWNLLIQRHDMLRCKMNEDITQKIIEDVPYQELTPIDITNIPESDIKEYLLNQRDTKLSSIPDPTELPLLTLEAYLLPNNKKKLHIYIDMLVCDASSMFILLKDLYQYYNFPETPLEPLGITFKDYLQYEQEHKDGEHFNKSLKYWRSRLETLPSGPSLALHKQPVEIKKPHFTRRTFKLNSAAWTRFQNISATLNVTPTAILLSLYAKVLATWSNSPHFCINLTHFHRMQAHKDVNKIIGDFTSLIPLEVNISATKEFSTYVKEIQSQLLNDLEHDDIGGVQILREMRSIGRESSMPVVFTSTLGLSDFECNWMGDREFTISQTPQVWIDNQIMQKDGELIINWDCIEGLFREQMLDCMFGIYSSLIDAVLKNIDLVKIDRYSPVVGRQDLLYASYNQTQDTLSNTVLPEQVMNMAFKYPNNEAIITSNKRITYKEVHNAASQLAEIIEKKELEEDAHVAILLPKGFEQIVAVVACGYAGVSYLPMAIEYPKKRVEYLIDEADITTVISTKAMFSSLELPSNILAIDVDASVDLNKDMPEYKVKAKEENLAYTIFTSGSTGKPKGVMITHESVCNTVMDVNKRFNITQDDKFFAISALNFDLSVYDIYGALTSGASIVVPDEEKRKDSADWYNWIKTEKITVWNSVPALMKLICEEAGYEKSSLPNSLRLVLLSGDFIPLSLYKDLNKITKDECEIISLGGATEASIWSIYFPIKDLDEGEEKIPYGYPLANQELYILDGALDSKPYLVHGDIYIKGKGIANGYFNDPKRTKSQFIVDPHNNEYLYKTGDIGFFNPKGYIDIIGRDDEQVKIQGYRVELGEIEQSLLEITLIKEAIVLAKEDDNKHNILIAYITTEGKEILDSEQIKFDLAFHLPEYMIPLAIITLDTMPLTTNGKVDKKALAELKLEVKLDHEYVAPRNEIEEKLSVIFADILKVEKVGIYDNFFELGGHSLLATQLVSKIRNELEVELPLKVLFSHTNVESLTEYIKTYAKKVSISNISVIKNRENLPLSFAQERLWFIDQLEPNSAEYNLPVAVNIVGKLDINKVEEALNIIIKRHENLRTIFPNKDGVPKQFILDSIDFKLQFTDLSIIKTIEERYNKAQELSQIDAEVAFDIARGPLIRASLLKINSNEHILLINSHHIISDGLSLGILFKDFSLIMDSFSKNEDINLPELSIQYADYSVWQRESLAKDDTLKEHLDYWKDELSPYPRKLNLSMLEKEKIDTSSKTAKTITQSLNSKILSKINTIAKENNWTTNQILLALYSALIYRYTNQDSMIIAVPNANRPTSETEQIFGFFVNTMLLKFDFDYASSYSDILNQTQDKLLSAIEHQDAPLQNIIENIRAQSNGLDMDDNFQFAFNSIPVSSLPNDINNSLSYSTFDTGVDSAKTLVTLTLAQKENSADLLLTYKDSILQDSKIEEFLNNYKLIIEEFCSNPQKLIILAPLFNDKILLENNHTLKDTKSISPLTQMQSDLYIQGKVNFENNYLIGWHYCVEHDINIDILKNSIDNTFAQIDIINSQIIDYSGLMYQIILNKAKTKNIVEIEFDEKQNLDISIRNAAKSVINIDNGSAVKAVFVYKKSKLIHVAYMAHHGIMDGLSIVYLKSMIDKNYKNYLKEEKFIQIEPKTSSTEIEPLIKRYNSKQKEIWKKPLANVGPVPIFNASNLGKQIVKEIHLDKDILADLNKLKKIHKLSIVSLINAIYISTLYRLFNFTEDLVLFEPLSIRKSLKEMSLGAYIDIKPIVIKTEWFTKEFTIISLAKNIEEFQKNNTEPLSMSEQSKLIHSNDVIFGVNFIPRLKQSELEPLDLIPEHEVQFTIFSGKSYILKFTFPENIFNGVNIDEKFLLAANNLLIDNDIEVLKMNFLAKKEEKELLSQFNATRKSYKNKKTIQHHFEKQVSLNPNNIALIYEGEALSYKQLNDKANQLAYFLMAQGIKVDDLVGICIDRSLEMIIGLLAILKAGGAYLPIDPSSPKDRIEYILEDSRTKLLLTQSKLQDTIPNTKAKIVYIDTLDVKENKKTNPKLNISVNSMAYVIYTSGSTGKPKGVILEHSNVDRLFQASKKEFNFTQKDSWTLFHSFAFDFSVWEIWGALLHGGKLHILSYDMTRSGEDFYNYLVNEKVTILNQTPAAFNQLIQIDKASDKKLSNLRKVIFGGEKLDFNILKHWYEKYDDKSPELINMYGITETTVHVTYHNISNSDILEKKSLIGKSYDDLSCYILDSNNNLVPKGLAGELHISGDGLARGYLYQEDLTDEKFINNPFEKNSKLYKTGDLVSFLENGSMEYLGRIDDQVKIRGFRIELGEIEQQLLNIITVDEAVVLVKQDQNNNKFLMTYITMKDNIDIEFSTIKAELSKNLPEYMLPTSMLKLEKMPLTSNGKIDKKALEKLNLSLDAEEEYVAPRNELEETLVRLFAQILNIPKVGIHDNFFNLGGNSLLSVQLAALIKAENLKVEVKDIFQAQCVSELCKIMLDDTVELPLDLDTEAFLENDIKALKQNNIYLNNDVLLTGATGFVGRYLLEELLESSDVNVYCAVRASTKEDGFKRIKKSLSEFGLWKDAYTSRIFTVISDLSKPKLGIKDLEYESLSKSISKVYHSATYMNHLATYAFLKEVNIGGLKELLRFVSNKRNKTLEYVSTIELLNDPNKEEFDENISLHDQIHFKANGYASTKFVAEEICLIAQKRGIDINIYRLGLITGDTKKGKNDSSQWFGQLLEASTTLGSLFDAKGFNIPVTPVNFVSKSIVSLANSTNNNKIYHITNNSSLKLGEMLEMYNDENESLEEISLFKFIQKLKAYNKENEELAITTFLMKYLDMSETELSILQKTDVKQKIINTTQTLSALKDVNVGFPDIDKGLIKKYFNASINL